MEMVVTLKCIFNIEQWQNKCFETLSKTPKTSKEKPRCREGCLR